MDLFDTGPLADMIAKYDLTPQWICWACGSSWLGAAKHDCPTTKKPDPDRAFHHQVMVVTTKAFRVRPSQIGIYPPCPCHPAPNPAARDYRRRTKHRNRRRK